MTSIPLPTSPSEAPTDTDIHSADTDTVLGGSSVRCGRRDLRAGAVVGRYVIRERLGAGGMGEVFAAYDGELDREVALKLIHASRVDDKDATLRECERLRAEAQALARLNHPNVVQIYEVGRHEDQTFLAMELVSGTTLSAFVAESLDELISVYAQAGRGLAAAHAAGLAHRDFKPGNAMLGDDGRVRVLDFGLAMPAAGLAKPEAAIVEGATTIGDDSDDLHARSPTSVGGPGTLPYMAPEQAFAGAGGPAADQFSFCVALFEAVYGVRPFPAVGVMDLLMRLDSCAVVFPPVARFERVPRWLRKLLLRGLSREPDQRFASMDALVSELTRDRRRVWRRIGFAGAVSAVTAVVVLAVTPPTPGHGASVDEPDLDGVWDAQRRTAVSGVFERSRSSWAEGSHAAVLAGLDAWSQRWITAARTAQAASDPFTGRAMTTCLEAQREQARITIDAVLDGDPLLLEGAVAAIDALPEPSRCVIGREGVSTAAIDPALLLPQLHALADAAAQRNFGNFELARVGAEAVLREAQVAGWTTLELAALRQRGLASIEAGAREAGLADLSAARSLAVRSGDRQSEAELSVDLAWASRKLDNEALRRDRLALARAHVDGLLDASSPADRHAQLLGARVQLAGALELLRAGDAVVLREAEALLHRGLDTLDLVEAGDSTLAIDYLHTLARVRDEAGEREQAEQDYRRAIARAERVRGAGHPSNARIWYNAGAFALDRGDLELARARLLRARDLRAAALRVDHPELARSELALAELEFRVRDFESAERHGQAAYAALEHAGGDQDALPETLRLLGQLEARADRWPAAVAYYERARALMTRPGIQRTLLELEFGKALAQVGEHQRGYELLDAALPVIAARLQPHCEQLIPTYEHHAELAQRLGHEHSARASLEAALGCTGDDPTRSRLEARLR